MIVTRDAEVFGVDPFLKVLLGKLRGRRNILLEDVLDVWEVFGRTEVHVTVCSF